MKSSLGVSEAVAIALTVVAMSGCADRSKEAPVGSPNASITPTTMVRIGTVDDRYQAFNVEMLEVTGGSFWRPYGPEFDAIIKEGKVTPASGSDTPAGMDPRLYEYRPPIDLTNTRLRKLATGLAPAYVRVSGTWANTTYFAEPDRQPSAPPSGFNGVLSRQQWKGVIDFARAVDAEIVTSFATSLGVRDRSGVWTAEQARRFVNYTKAAGGRIAAAEFMNEPTLALMGGAPKGYDAAAYGRDFKVFHTFARETLPDMLILGPGSVAETTGDWGISYGTMSIIKTRDLLAASAPARVDVFAYHHYGGSSQRCAAMGMQTTADAALSEQWLRRTDETLAFYRKLRDEFDPGVPFWLTETADTACGGNPWGKTFLDTFRYLDQLGRLARQEVRVVMHNTLAASDYGLLDEKTFTPRPNYWAGLLWRRLMGSTVLDSGIPIREGLHVYAHCLRGAPGGVALLAINNSRTASQTLQTPAADRYTLSAQTLESGEVQLNGQTLSLQANDEIPAIQGNRTPAGAITLAPATVTFFAFRNAANATCH